MQKISAWKFHGGAPPVATEVTPIPMPFEMAHDGSIWPFTSFLVANNRQRSDGKPTCGGQAWRVEADPSATSTVHCSIRGNVPAERRELVLKNILMGLPLGRGRPTDAANPAGLGDPRCARQ
jgi:hypothetical protein